MSTVTFTAAGREHTIDTAALPEASRLALLRRGLTHFLGNEQAAKVSAAKAKRAQEIASHDPAGGTEAPVAHTDEEISGLVQGFTKDALEALHGGTIGQGRAPAAPKADPLQTEALAIATRQVRHLLKTSGIAVAKGGAVNLPDGTTSTVAEYAAKRVASEKYGPAIMTEAKATIKARDKEAKALGTPAQADVMGLLA